jgi:COMPASS component SWD3
VYDEETRKMELKLSAESSAIPGHTNRVFSVKFDPEDPNIIVTGGWDQKVLIWDIRTKRPVRTFAGPLICADGIDIFEEVVLTGSWRESDQVQMWDLGTGKLISTVKWEGGIKVSNDPCFVYANQFSKVDGSLILAGGSNSNEVRIFDRNKLDSLVCVIYDMSREVTTVDFSNNGDKFLTAGSDGMVRVFNMNIIA